MKRNILLAVVLSIASFAYGQQPDFRPPLDIPLFLSGNFGELRSNHFHSGIDFKTQGVTGHKVFAVESGYVSRIKVQTGGYGKALYIDHPGGYTSVYCHLDQYNEKISEYVLDMQYRRKSHGVDLYLEPGVIKVSKSEVIALSGNTGSSSGPHLHFEIRRSADQVPLNSLLFDFPIADDIAPRIMQAAIYPLDRSASVDHSSQPLYLETKKSNEITRVVGHEPIPVNGPVGFGIEVYDYLNGAANRCGIFSLDLKVDGKRTFYSEMGEFSFAESRFINAHIDYAHHHHQHRKIQRLYKLPYNALSIYKFDENEGAVVISDTLVHEVNITATDSYGNQSSLVFEIKGTSLRSSHEEKMTSGHLLPYDRGSTLSEENISLSFPAFCFYEDVDFNLQVIDGPSDLYSDIFVLHDGSVPVHKRYEISITPHLIPGRLTDRLCLVSVQDDGSFNFAGGIYSEGHVSAELRSFGRYAIGIDTIPPEITPLDLFPGKDVSSQPGIRFRIRDDLSGVSEYNGTINGQWVLFEYDPKNELLFHEFDNRVPYSKKNNELEIVLTDTKGNKTKFRTTFIR